MRCPSFLVSLRGDPTLAREERGKVIFVASSYVPMADECLAGCIWIWEWGRNPFHLDPFHPLRLLM